MKPVAQGQAQKPRPQVGPANPAPAQQQAAAIHQANGQSAAAPPVVYAQLHPMPQARQIQNDWHQSVEQLNTEIRELRTMLENLLREIRALIQDYDMHTDLQPVMEAVATAVKDVGNVVRSMDHVDQTLRTVVTTNWSPDAAKRLANVMNPLNDRAARLRKIIGEPAHQAPNQLVQVPQQPTLQPLYQLPGNQQPVAPLQPAQPLAQGQQSLTPQPALQSGNDQKTITVKPVTQREQEPDESDAFVGDSSREDLSTDS